MNRNNDSRDPISDIVSFCEMRQPSEKLVSWGHFSGESESERLREIGGRLFYLDGQDPNADDIDKNESFLKAFLEHLERHRVLLFEGASGSGKSTLVEEIAMLYISGERDGRFAEATNPDVAREEQATIVGARWTRTRDGRANMYLAVANIDGNMKYRVEMEFSSGGGTRRKCMGIDDSNGGDSEYGTNIAVWDIGFEIPLFVQNGDGRVEISIILEQAVRDQTNSNGLNWTNCASLEGVEETNRNPSNPHYI